MNQLRACQILIEQAKENADIGRIIISYYHINMISFLFVYGFLKTKYLNKIGTRYRYFSQEGDVW